MSSSRGPPFTASRHPPVVLQWTAECNAALPGVLRTCDTRGLVHRLSETTGLGTYVADGCTIAHGTRLVVHWGHVTPSPPASSLHVLDLPPTHHGGDMIALSVDASLSCLRGDPPVAQAALLNHKCEDPTCAASWIWSDGCTLPIMVCTSRRSLRGGSELTYNYDSHLRHGAYTLGPDEAFALALRGITTRPCLCEGPAACPRLRSFPAPRPPT